LQSISLSRLRPAKKFPASEHLFDEKYAELSRGVLCDENPNRVSQMSRKMLEFPLSPSSVNQHSEKKDKAIFLSILEEILTFFGSFEVRKGYGSH